jgi:pimeloyl-ACP methyl ester carboxylesterase
MYKLLVYITVLLCCTGCFRRWVMSDKQIRAHYAGKAVKPVYFTVENDSVEVFCATTGSDTLPPLVLIHGAPGAWYGSRNMLDDSLLQKHYQIIAVDRPGYRKSKFKRNRRTQTSIEQQAIALHEVLRVNRSFKKGVVLGSSYGAPIAAAMAIRYPDEFRHLFMLAPAIDPEKEKFWWFHKYFRSGIFVRFLPKFIQTATAEKFAHASELYKLDSQWPKLRVPATVMQGGYDNIVDPANFDYAKRVLKGKPAEFVFFPTGRHLLRWQEADTIRSYLLKVLR